MGRTLCPPGTGTGAAPSAMSRRPFLGAAERSLAQYRGGARPAHCRARHCTVPAQLVIHQSRPDRSRDDQDERGFAEIWLLTWGFVARREGLEPPTARSVGWCSTSTQCARVLSVQLRSDAKSSQTARVLSGAGWWTDTRTDTSPRDRQIRGLVLDVGLLSIPQCMSSIAIMQT